MEPHVSDSNPDNVTTHALTDAQALVAEASPLPAEEILPEDAAPVLEEVEASAFDLNTLPPLAEGELVDAFEFVRTDTISDGQKETTFSFTPGCPLVVVRGHLCVSCGKHRDGNPQILPIAVSATGEPEAVVRLVDGKPRLISGAIEFRRFRGVNHPCVVGVKEGESPARLISGHIAIEKGPKKESAFVELAGAGQMLGITHESRIIDAENNRLVVSARFVAHVESGGLILGYTDGIKRVIFREEQGFSDCEPAPTHIAMADAYTIWRRRCLAGTRNPAVVSQRVTDWCEAAATAHDALVVFHLGTIALSAGYLARERDRHFRGAFDRLIDRLLKNNNKEERQTGEWLVSEGALKDLRRFTQAELFNIQRDNVADNLDSLDPAERNRRVRLLTSLALKREEFEEVLKVYDALADLQGTVPIRTIELFVTRVAEEGFGNELADQARKYNPKVRASS